MMKHKGDYGYTENSDLDCKILELPWVYIFLSAHTHTHTHTFSEQILLHISDLMQCVWCVYVCVRVQAEWLYIMQ